MPTKTLTKRRGRSMRHHRYAEITNEMIQQFAALAKQTSESIVKDQTHEMILDPKIIQTLRYVEQFIVKHKLVVYGGTALNAILPPKDRFYSPEFDLPDWDFFSDNPVRHAVAIADEVHVKTGAETFVTTAAHHGTYKVYSDGVSIADITYVEKPLLDVLRKRALIRDDVLYSGPDYLRMAAYLELSRPRGQVDRWEKVMKRLLLLNRAHPIQIRDYKPRKQELPKQIRVAVMKCLVSLQVSRKKNEEEFAFFGPESVSLLRRSIGRDGRKRAPELGASSGEMFPMILSPSPKKTLQKVLSALRKDDTIHSSSSEGGQIVSICRKGRGEFLPNFYEIRMGRGGPIMGLILGTSNGCQSVYHLPARVPADDGKKTHIVTIASIESCLYMYLAVRFAKNIPVPASAILKVCNRLVNLHFRAMEENKHPVLPLPTQCVGEQETIRDMRKEKQKRIKEITSSRGWRTSAEYFLWNIRYNGGDTSRRDTIFRALKRYEEKQPVSANKTLKKKRQA